MNPREGFTSGTRSTSLLSADLGEGRLERMDLHPLRWFALRFLHFVNRRGLPQNGGKRKRSRYKQKKKEEEEEEEEEEGGRGRGGG